MRFHKSLKLGPFRINLSKKGVGISAGVPGARVSMGADGIARATVGIPGSGISQTQALKRSKRAFTLIELMIVVAIVGVLSALAIYGVTKYLRSSKTAEVKTALGQMSKDAVSAFNREQMAGTVLADKGAASVANQLCQSASATVPASITDVKGKKYQSSTAIGEDWTKDKGALWTGFSCLKFGINEPQYFMYDYQSSSSGFTAAGYGDLNGDGTTSTFSMNGEVSNGVVKMAPNFNEVDPEE